MCIDEFILRFIFFSILNNIYYISHIMNGKRMHKNILGTMVVLLGE